jgi:hypothetical protein
MTPRKTPEPSPADIRAALRILARDPRAHGAIAPDVMDAIKRRGFAEVADNGAVFLLPDAIHFLVPNGELGVRALAWTNARKAHAEAKARADEADRAFYTTMAPDDWRRSTAAQAIAANRVVMASAVHAYYALSRYLAEHPDV